ncbi:MAG: hypothetical protein OXB84_00960 [Halobacteriovoraceae bacterium]|nr:hypothetical protein [Halobacteriovoraceae bacterium]
MVAATGCAVFAHENSKGKIPGVDRYLKKAEVIPLARNEHLTVLDTPGHTFAHVSLLLRSEKGDFAVFTGDTLFNAGVGNCYNGGDVAVLYQTISHYFQSMDDGVLLYPGHEYMENNLRFTLECEPDNQAADELLARCKKQKNGHLVNSMGLEKKINLFLRADRDSFVRYRGMRDKW